MVRQISIPESIKVLEAGRKTRSCLSSGDGGAVLAEGPAEYHMQAAMVLTLNGVEMSRGGDDPDSDWELTFANGDKQTVKPHHWIEPDSHYSPLSEPPPTLDAAAMRTFPLAYAAMFIVSGALALGAYAAQGTVQVVLAVLAGILFAAALWSTLFMSVVRIFQRGFSEPSQTPEG